MGRLERWRRVAGARPSVGDVLRAALLRVRRRAEPSASPAGPAPSLTRLDALIDEVAAGQPVRWRVGGQPRPLPAAVDVAAYRIIQEALTDARRHAPGAAVAVRLRYDPAGLTVEVRGDGPAIPVAGLRTRAESVGGAFHAGPRPEGGWLVRAELPAPEDEAEPA
ncbi:sensor histidine kinase [Micromonospora sp. NPDC005299]|uniref:sensor histidine kinase n=1 Tax=Micromonospora sp. NPDC005299 TaxID=3364231 RepID=UPI0036C7F67A